MSEIEKKEGGNIEQAIHSLFQGLHNELSLNLADENFYDTPKRVSRSFKEILEGLVDTDARIEQILSTAFPSKDYDSIILCSDVLTYSMCPHHLLPVEYKIDIGYLPSEKGQVLGLSKLVRIVEILSHRPVLQETLTQEIVEAMDRIKPRGIGVVIRGRHLCMKMRGVKTPEGSVTTSAMKGEFMDNPTLRSEFMTLLELSRLNR